MNLSAYLWSPVCCPSNQDVPFTDSLIACSLVNRSWFRAARNPELYRRLCQLPEWGSPSLDHVSPSINPITPPVDTMESTNRSISSSSSTVSAMDCKTIDVRFYYFVFSVQIERESERERGSEGSFCYSDFWVHYAVFCSD